MTIDSAATRGDRPLLGVSLMLGAVFMFTLLDATAKSLSLQFPVMMVVWARYAVHAALMLLVYAPKHGRALFATRQPRLQLLRGLALAFSTIFFFTGLSMMPLAEASSITATAPILVTLAAVRWLGESPPRGAAIALTVSFVGVLLIVRPGGSVFHWSVLFPVLTALGNVTYQLLTRRLSSVDPSLTLQMLGATTGFVVLSLVVPFYWQTPTDPWHWPLFLLMGAAGLLGHQMMIGAFSVAPASTVSPFTYFQVVFALMFGWLVFGDFPDGWALAGIALIVVTGVAMTLVNHYRAEPVEE